MLILPIAVSFPCSHLVLIYASLYVLVPNCITLTFNPSVHTFEDYDKFLPTKRNKPGHIFDKNRPAKEIKSKLDEIKGHLVWMPLDFLKDVEMAEESLTLNQWTESIYT
jgi:hypothetical protein